MARFEINQPVTTAEPRAVVDAGLPVGRHRFQLVVTDDSGNESAPDFVTVTVFQPQVIAGTGTLGIPG